MRADWTAEPECGFCLGRQGTYRFCVRPRCAEGADHLHLTCDRCGYDWVMVIAAWRHPRLREDRWAYLEAWKRVNRNLRRGLTEARRRLERLAARTARASGQQVTR